jgi:hypothetical protein
MTSKVKVMEYFINYSQNNLSFTSTFQKINIVIYDTTLINKYTSIEYRNNIIFLSDSS